MSARLVALPFTRLLKARSTGAGAAARAGLEWRALPAAAQIYLAVTIAVGCIGFVTWMPRTIERPVMFLALLAASCITSSWKINLPISLMSGSTLSVSYAANLVALLLLGPQEAVAIAVAGAWTQCTVNVKKPYPLYRTVFSAAAEAITMVATGAAYEWLGGAQGPLAISSLARPLVGAIAMYFFVNTGLVAAAIGFSTHRSIASVWRDDFLWSSVSFLVAGTAGAGAAVVIQRGDHWKAALLLAPIYLTYRTYRLFVARLEDQKRHVEETQRLHQETIRALDQARRAEQALASEKERLAIALSDMTKLEEIRHQLLEREQSARASAEQANRLKDQFLAIVSHELRTPLTAVLGWAQMLRQDTLGEAKRDRAVQAIFANAERQARLIEELLDVARITSGKLQLVRAAVDWREVVGAAVDVVQPAAAAKGITISADVDASVGPFFGDGARLQQIVWNLLTNAVKFTPEQGALRVHVRQDAETVEVTVNDNGLGIPPEYLGSVFEPFRQVDGSTTRRHGGLGLGLAIVKHLVEAHGGTVRVDSAGNGLGSTFTITLPINASAEDLALAIIADDEGAGANAQGAVPSLLGTSVLVVDDDDESRDVVVAYLEGQKASVLTAASAAEALEVLRHQRVDVLLADIAMPEQDGYELLRQVRELPAPCRSRIPAAAVTAFARKEDRQRAIDAGFQMHVAKPVDLQVLVRTVATLRDLRV